MKTYLSPDNKLYAYELDGSQDDLIPSDYKLLSEQEVQAFRDAEEEAARTAYLNSLTYAEKRAAAYPPITDYIDGVVKNDQAQIDKYIADCLAVKAKYPKP